MNTANASCTGTDAGNLIDAYSGNSLLEANDWTLTSGYLRNRAAGSGTASFIGDNVTITNGGGGQIGAIHISGSQLGNNTSLIISNSSISSTFASGHGLASHANNATGNASMEVTNTNVNMAASTTSGYGIVVNAIGSGTATLRVNGGAVTTYNSSPGGIDAGYAVTVYSGSGNVDARLSGGTITSSGNNAQGINAVVANGNGTLYLENGDTISTGGSSAHGIYAHSANGALDVINTANVTTGGVGAYGIYTQSVNGNSTLTNSGDIKTTNTGTYIHGLYSKNSGTGSATITNTGNVTISGTGTALRSETVNGDAIVNQQGGDLIANGALENGVAYAYTNGAGNAIVDMSGGTLTNNSTSDMGHGLEAKADGSGNAVIKFTAGSVVTQTGYGIAAWRGATGTGDASTTTAEGTSVNARGAAATGIYTYGATTASVDSKSTVVAGGVGVYGKADSGAVTVKQTGGSVTAGGIGIRAKTPGAIDITNSVSVKTTNGSAHGISAEGGTGAINVNNSGNLNTVGSGSIGISGTSSSGDLSITNSGNIITQGGAAAAIRSMVTGSGQLTVNNGGVLHTQNGIGIWATIDAAASVANITVNNTGAITTESAASHGIQAFNTGHGDAVITNSGDIITNGNNTSDGIQAVSVQGNASIASTGANITTTGGGVQNNGIYARADQGIASIVFRDGTVKVTGQASGLVAGNESSGLPSIANIKVINSVIDGSQAIYGAVAARSETSNIDIDATSQVHGGWASSLDGAGVDIDGTTQTLTNNGTIDAMSDLAVRSGSWVPGGNLTLINNNQITGVIAATDVAVTMDNAGTWNVRHFADTTGSGTRDTLAVAVSDFGSSGNNSVTNSGVIALLGDNGQASTLDNTGAYATGYAANTMAIGGAAQGQILNVKSFSNSGTIDLGPANAAVGDVLVISGGNSPGVSGGGTYVADGGRVILDTVLNEGGANSQSDMLVVDGTQLGSAADKITVINTGGAGAKTPGNGIELVRVLDSNRSAAGAFKLDSRVVAGAYEYDLYQGGVGADSGDGNWYLRTLTQPDPRCLGSDCGGGDNGGNGDNGSGNKPLPRTETGVYLRNMTAASGMFMHTLHDRLGEPQYTDRQKDEKDGKVTSLWVRVVGNHSDGQAANGEIDMSTDTSLVHLGGDLARWSNDGKDRWQFGLMGAYGQSDTDADPVHHKQTNSGYKRTANGKVDGYGAGAYLTWYGNKDKPTGPYVDLWTMYGWYNNKVQGNTLPQEKYDSTNWTTSIEGGYAFIGHDGEQRQWMIEPQAQLAYNSYSADNHREQNGTWVTDGNQDGVVTRLGARLYSRSKLGDNGVQPFVEANWWHGTAQNSLRFNGDVVSDGTPKDTFELKAGLQGEIAKNWQLWGHVGGRWGSNSYSSYEGMVGVKYQF